MKKYKSLFLSDIHLGSPHTKSKQLFDMLKNTEAENLFLLGDIVTKNAKDNDSDIIEFINIINSKSWNIIYIIGNHEKDREGNIIELSNNKPFHRYKEYIYNNGHINIYLTHGDSFHTKDIFNRMLKYTLCKIKKTAQQIEDNKSRGEASTFYHKKVKPIAQKYLHNSYVKYLSKLAQKNNCQSTICGHIHLPEIIETTTITYLNCGDWINHTSYIVEELNGQLELIIQG